MPMVVKFASIVCLALALTGCELAAGSRGPLGVAPQITPPSPTGISLESLPPPKRPIDIALSSFPDLTGQNKPSDNFAEFSRAVTQGGSAFVIDALNRAGGGKWFNVIERGGLQALLQERQLIRATRQEFEGAKAKPLPPLRFAGLLLEGGILAYDANTITGGIGARFLGIGGDTKYRRDMVTVALRVISVQSGQVLLSVTTTKTIFSVGLSSSLYRFVALDRIAEAEGGFTHNEPTQLAVREAIELAIYSLIMEGAEKKLWSFRSDDLSEPLRRRYKERPLTVKAELTDGLPTQYASAPLQLPWTRPSEELAPAEVSAPAEPREATAQPAAH